MKRRNGRPTVWKLTVYSSSQFGKILVAVPHSLSARNLEIHTVIRSPFSVIFWSRKHFGMDGSFHPRFAAIETATPPPRSTATTRSETSRNGGMGKEISVPQQHFLNLKSRVLVFGCRDCSTVHSCVDNVFCGCVGSVLST